MSEYDLGEVSIQVSIDDTNLLREAIQSGQLAGNQLSKALQDALGKGGTAAGKAARTSIDKELQGALASITIALDTTKAKTDLASLYQLTSKPIVIQVQATGLTEIKSKLEAITKSSKVTLQIDSDLEASITKAIQAGFKSGSKAGLDSITSGLSGVIMAPFKMAASGLGSIFSGIGEGIGQQISKNLGRGLANGLENQFSTLIGSFSSLGESLGDALAESLLDSLGSDFYNVKSFFEDTLGKEEIVNNSASVRNKQSNNRSQVRKDASEQVSKEYDFVVQNKPQLIERREVLLKRREDINRQKELIDQKISNKAEGLGRGSLQSRVDNIDSQRDVVQKNFESNYKQIGVLEKEKTSLTPGTNDYKLVEQKIIDLRSSAALYAKQLKSLTDKRNSINDQINKVNIEAANQFKDISDLYEEKLEQLVIAERKFGRVIAAVENIDLVDKTEKPLKGKNVEVANKASVPGTEESQNISQFYKAVFTDVAKLSNVSNAIIPRLEAANLPSGANAAYSEVSNKIQVSPQMLEAVHKGTVTQKQLETLIHEIRHSLQSSIGEANLITPTAKEAKNLGGKIEASVKNSNIVDKDSLRQEEADAYVFAQRNVKDLSEKYEKQQAKSRLINSSGVGGGKLNLLLQAKEKEVVTSLLQASQTASVNVNDEVTKALSDIDKAKASLSPIIDRIANVDLLSIEEINQLNSHINNAVGQALADIELIGVKSVEDIKIKPSKIRDKNKVDLTTLNRKKELEPLAKEFGVDTTGLNKKQIIDQLGNVNDINTLTAKTDAIMLARANKKLEHQQNLQKLESINLKSKPLAALLPKLENHSELLPITSAIPKPNTAQLAIPQTFESPTKEIYKESKNAGTEVLASAKVLSSKIEGFYKSFISAKKAGDTELAIQYAKGVKDYTIKYQASMAEARKLLGEDAAIGTKIGSQLTQQESQLAKKRNTADRFIKVNSSRTISSDLDSIQRPQEEEDAKFALEDMREGLAKLRGMVKAVANRKNDPEVNVQNSTNKIEQNLNKFEKAENEINGRLQKANVNLESSLAAEGGKSENILGRIGLILRAETLDNSVGGISKLGAALSGTLRIAGGLGALAFIAPMFAGFANVALQAAEAAEKLSVKMAFAEGSTEKAAKSIAYAKNVAKELGTNQNIAVNSFAGLTASTADTALEGQATKQIFEGLSKGGASRQLGKQEMQSAFLAIQQISDKGKVSQEELRGQLSERLSGTMAVASRSRGQTVAEMNRDIQKGVTSEEFLPKFAQQLSAESALSLPAAMNSSIAVANRFENSITNIQETLGKGLLPVKNAGLSILTSGMETLIAITPGLLNLGGMLSLSWGFGLAKSFIASGVGAGVLSAGLKSIGTAALTTLSHVLKLGGQFLLFSAAIEVIKAVGFAMKDASGESRKFADDMAKSNEKINELRNPKIKKTSGELQETALVDGTFLSGLSKRYNEDGSLGDKAGYFLRAGLGGAEQGLQKLFGGSTYADKKRNDITVATGDITSNAASLTNQMQSDLVNTDSAINKVAEYNKQLDLLQEKKRALVALNPGDTAGKQALQLEEDRIRKSMEAVTMVTGAQSAQNQTNIDVLKKEIEKYEKLASEPGDNQGKYAEGLKALKLELSAAESTQDKFNKTLKEGTDAFTRFSVQMATAFDKLADGTERINLSTTTAKTVVLDAQLNGDLSNSQAGIMSQGLEAQGLQDRLAATVAALSNMTAVMESQSSILKAYGVTENTGKAELATLGEKTSNPKDKEVIVAFSKFQDTKAQKIQLENELKTSQVAAQSQIKETTKQVGDFFKDILEQTNSIAVETKSSKNKVAMLKAETKLRSALTGFQDNFVTSYVDSLVGFLKLLNKPLEDAIAAQGQLVNNASGLRNALLQGLQMRDQIASGQSGDFSVPEGNNAGKVVVQRTDVKDVNGLEDLLVTVFDESGKSLGQYKTNSGQSYAQDKFGGAYSTRAGSMAPIEYGEYSIGAPMDGRDDPGMRSNFIPIDPKFKTDRAGIGFHLDGNRSTAPGSAGCIVFKTEKDFNDFQNALKKSGAKSLDFRDGKALTQQIQAGGNKTQPSSGSQSNFSGAPKGLNQTQLQNASVIAREGQAAGLNANQIAAVTASAMQESTLGMAKDEVGGYGGKGLFQLTDAEGQSGSWIGKGGIRSTQDYYDPVKNTKAIFEDYAFQDWKRKSANQSIPDAATSFAKDVLRPYEVGDKYAGRARDLYPSGNAGMMVSGGGVSAGVSNNTAGNAQNNRMLDSARQQAINNNLQQAENIKSQLAAQGQLDALQAKQAKNKLTDQFKTGLDDTSFAVKQQERQAEDKDAALGFTTPQKQRDIDVRSADREFYDSNKDLIKQLKDLRSAREDLKASIAVISEGGFQGADQLKDQLPMLTDGLKKTEENVSKIEGLVGKASKQRDAKVADINEKFKIADESRRVGVESQLANLIATRQKLDSDMGALTYSPGKDLIGDKSKSDIGEKRALHEVDKKTLAEQLRTGQLTNAEYERMLALKISILNQEISINETQAARDKQKLKLEIDNKVFDSDQALMSGKADLLAAQGKTGASDELKQQMQIGALSADLTNGMAAIDDFARSTNASAETVAQLRNNLVELNSVKLDTLRAQFNPFQEVANTAKSAVGGFFKDMLMGTKSVKDAFKDMITNILSKVADLAVNALMNDLFSGGKGNSGGGGGLFSNLLGGIFGGGNKAGESAGKGVGGLIGNLLGGGNSGGKSSGGGGGIGGLFSGVLSMFGGGSIMNFAGGNLEAAYDRERIQSGGLKPKLAMVNSEEIILSANQSKKFRELGLGRKIQNFAAGNLEDISSGNSGSTTINVPVTVNSSGGEQPKVNGAALSEAIRGAVNAELLRQQRNGGTLSK